MQEPPPTGLELSVLGPVRLLRDGRPVALGTRKTQALLLVLALEGGASRERLCELLWSDLDEASARRNLRREMVRLREAGAADALRVEGPQLHPGAALQCDLLRAEAALARGAPDDALLAGAGELADGLQLHEAVSFAPWLATARERARRLRQQAREASAAAAELRGDTAAALAQVLALLDDDGLQERYHREAMRLLLASGQREAALRQFERCRALLAGELGLQPMPQTLALAQSLRSAEAVPPPAPPAMPLQAWPARLPFVGREAEVVRLQSAWSRGQAALIVGEAGVGKTRLASDFAASQGPHALVRCQPGDSDLVLGAFARVLRALAGQPPDLGALDGWIVAELARLLPELGPAPPALRSEDDRLRFDEACIQAWATLSHGAFDGIVLDDWQLADPASRALLARTAGRRREAGPGGAIELISWRGAPDEPELLALTEALEAECIVLAPLQPAAVYALVQQLSGAADPARFAERLGTATGGYPFFIAETLRDLAERSMLEMDADGRWRTPFDVLTQDYRELPMPASVRDAVLTRVRRLDASAARLLEAAALAGEPFGAAWLASACALSELEALRALEQAAAAQLVQARDEGGYGWVHDLARQALDSAVAPTRRRLVQHRLALAAEALGASADAARHFEACGERHRAVPHRRALGDAARALGALEEAQRHWQQGLADEPQPGQTVALLARTLEAHHMLGRHAAAEEDRGRLEDLLASTELPPASAVEAGHALVLYLTRDGRAELALAWLDRLPPPPDEAGRLRGLTLRMGALQQRGRIDEARGFGVEALALAPPAGPERAEVLCSLAMLEFSSGHVDAAVDFARQFVGAARQRGDGLMLARALQLLGAFHAAQGDLAEAEGHLREAVRQAERLGQRPTQLMALYNLAVLYLQQTRADAALAAAHEGWPLCQDAPTSEERAMFRILFVDAHYTLGDWGQAWAHIEPAITEVLAIGQPLSMAGVAMAVLEPMAMLGQWAQAARLLAALDDATLAQSRQAGYEVWLGCAVAALLRGDGAEAGAWLARLGAPETVEDPRVRQRLMLVDARRRWLAADTDAEADAALAQIPADDAPGMNDELRLRALALRCTVRPDTALRAQAMAALGQPGVHAAAALELAQAVGGRVLATRVQHLSASLGDWPEVQASFQAAWQRRA